LEKILGDMFMAINIAHPGMLRVDRGSIFIGDELYSTTRGYYHHLYMTLLEANQKEWPKLGTISLSRSFDWVSNIPGMDIGFPTGKIGRAISAFSNLFTSTAYSEEKVINIAWALLGLEALYTSSSTDLSNQIHERTQLYLGKIEKYKKSLRQAYDFRSRFLHGDANFPVSYAEYDIALESENFLERSSNATNFMIAILIATLQKMCLENKYEIKFKLILDE
jgi:hypothetical protein